MRRRGESSGGILGFAALLLFFAAYEAGWFTGPAPWNRESVDIQALHARIDALENAKVKEIPEGGTAIFKIGDGNTVSVTCWDGQCRFQTVY